LPNSGSIAPISNGTSKPNIPFKEVYVIADGNDVYLKAREKSLIFKGQLKLVDALFISAASE
jgi:hypothetical protein